jgi:phospholipid transport system transporter-binding protein
MKQRQMKGKKTSKSVSRKPARSAAAPKKLSGQVALPAECVIASVDDLKADLLTRLTFDSSVTIDAAAVQRIDTASLQLLAAFARDRRAAGLPFEWTGVPASVTEAANLLNLTDTLGLPA